MNQIRILVVDDSAFMRQTLKAMIEEDPGLRVVATARSGQDAIEKLVSYRPDVVTLDIVLPDKSGLEVLDDIMSSRATPTIMVSGASNDAANLVIEAISKGAVDFISKPAGGYEEIGRIQRELQSKIKQSIHAKLSLPNSPAIPRAAQTQPKDRHPSASPCRNGLICIGTSTGGPKALQVVVPLLAGDLPVPVVIVQHMPAKFTKSLADRLDRLSPLSVCEAQNGEVLLKGRVYIAPGGRHMKVRRSNGRLVSEIVDGAPVHGVKPSVDVLLRSLAEGEDGGCRFVVAILTGMGRDGADGLAELKEKKTAYAIAESAETAVVFGMPKAAIETGAVDEVCSLHEVASAICNQFYHLRS